MSNITAIMAMAEVTSEAISSITLRMNNSTCREPLKRPWTSAALSRMVPVQSVVRCLNQSYSSSRLS
jgi:hypothetical protein